MGNHPFPSVRSVETAVGSGAGNIFFAARLPIGRSTYYSSSTYLLAGAGEDGGERSGPTVSTHYLDQRIEGTTGKLTGRCTIAGTTYLPPKLILH